MKLRFHTKKYILLAAALILSFTSCQKKVPDYDTTNNIILEVKETQDPDFNHKHMADFKGKICVLFGFGFNSQEYVSEATAFIDNTFGTTDDGSIILPVVYPDDLKNHIMSLREVLNEQDIKGLIFMGAPESTHNLLRNLETYWEGPLPYPVFSFFPQDNIQGQEAYCNFVLDYEPISDAADEELKAAFNTRLHDISLLLLQDSVTCMTTLQAPLNWDKDLFNHVRYITGNNSIKRYRDTSTGIAASNHFVLKIVNTDENQSQSLLTNDDGTPLTEEEVDAALLKFMEEN